MVVYAKIVLLGEFKVLQNCLYIKQKINPASLLCGVLTIGVLSVGYASVNQWGGFLTQQPPSTGIALCTVVFYGALCCALVTYAQLQQCTRALSSTNQSDSNHGLQTPAAYQAV